MSLVKRRFPSYLAGLFLGLAVALVWWNLRTAFAPKFEDVVENLPKISMAPGAAFSLKYKQNPEKHLAWGFPSALFIGQAMPNGTFKQILNINYAELVEQEVKIPPLTELGLYEMKLSLSSCEFPGAAVCLRKYINIPLEVKLGASMQSAVEIDLLSRK